MPLIMLITQPPFVLIEWDPAIWEDETINNKGPNVPNRIGRFRASVQSHM